MDPERVAVAEPCREVLVVSDKTLCKQFDTVKQSALFHTNHKEHKHKHKRGMTVVNRFCFSLKTLDPRWLRVSLITSYNNREIRWCV